MDESRERCPCERCRAFAGDFDDREEINGGATVIVAILAALSTMAIGASAALIIWLFR